MRALLLPCLRRLCAVVRGFRDGSQRAGANEQTVFASSALNSDAMSARPVRSTVRLAFRNPQAMQQACRSAETLWPLDRSHGPGHRPSVLALPSLSQRNSRVRQYATISDELANLARRAQAVA
jgi:hypothetical protein